jgi:Ohr subfamily peroxiredoxin
MSQVMEVLYTTETGTTGDRECGISRSPDGLLDIRFSIPGSTRIGTNPEQLFAAAWSASLASAIALVARKRKIVLPADVSIDAVVDLKLAEDGYCLSIRLTVRLRGIEPTTAKMLVDEAHGICPYSRATRGNIDVVFNVA